MRPQFVDIPQQFLGARMFVLSASILLESPGSDIETLGMSCPRQCGSEFFLASQNNRLWNSL
jgi:hypothetical protein